MNICRSLLTRIIYLISAFSLCQCILRQKCQVLEKKYYALHVDLKFGLCSEFEELDFTIAVNCDMVEDLEMSLKEVPLDSDWLCLTNYLGVTIDTKSFHQFTNLKALYIHGDLITQAQAFKGLSQLSILWIESRAMDGSINLHKDTFYGLNVLQELKLSGLRLSQFNSSIFSHLPLLTNLILEYNNITCIGTVIKILKEIENLQKLSFISNNIDELRECLTSPYPSSNSQVMDFNISYLHLSQSQLWITERHFLRNFPHLEMFSLKMTGFDIEDILSSGIKTIKTFMSVGNSFYLPEICKFASFFKVKELLLTNNAINRFSTSTGSCKRLQKLDLSYNYLQAIHLNQIKRLSSLLELNLCNNEITYVKICGNDSSTEMELVYLNLSINYLTRVQKLQFACLRNLRILALDNNRINYIEDSAFDGLSHLQVLNLQFNSIFLIGESTFQNLFSITHLNLYENILYKIDGNAFRSMINLRDFRVTFADMLDIYWWHSVGHWLQHLSAKTEQNLQLVNEYLDSFPMIEYLELDSKDIFLNCDNYVFSEIKELYLKNIIVFQCFEMESNPFSKFTNLEKLYYASNSDCLTDVTLNSSMKHLPMLNFLHLKDTDKLVKSGQINFHELFHGLFNLRVLYLENSGIDQFDSEDIFCDLKQLEFLVIENQIIQEMKGNVFAVMPNLKYILFLQTRFPCQCKFSELFTWLEAGTSVSIINFHNQECYVYKTNMNLVSFLLNNCQSDLNFIMFILTFVFTLLFMSISLFYESIWWYILYMFYTIKCWLSSRHRKRDHYEYDVFVSYNGHEEQWVTEQLLHNLEQNGPPFFKVCIHNRDFEIGRDIVENIVDSIYNSRWTICVITRSYLQSNWCSLEIRMATYRLVAESKDSLILVFLDDIPREELQYYHRITTILEKKTYLEWPEDEDGQQLFWARLRKVISNDGRKPR
ncbi:uncharacterized protein LOC143768449 [Ranitomeya variabilis]|uniref:uncharacterized protein LOC143768449 n=1 Tax=Ranitomeya variabilis TaxID=490064 RepID=UPI004056E957